MLEVNLCHILSSELMSETTQYAFCENKTSKTFSSVLTKKIDKYICLPTEPCKTYEYGEIMYKIVVAEEPYCFLECFLKGPSLSDITTQYERASRKRINR